MESLDLFNGFYKNKTVLVTGHTGFKGSWLCLWLHKLGANVIGFSNDIPTQPSLFESIGLSERLEDIRGDIRDRAAISQCISQKKPDIVFHLAAQPIVRESYLFPIETFETNVIGTAHVLEACRHTPSVRTVIVVSSDKCYDVYETQSGYTETDPMGGQDPYSASKGCTELVTASYRESFFKSGHTQLASARAGNVIGGGDWAKNRLIPDAIQALLSGSLIELRNPLSIRPWQHVLTPLWGYLLLGSKLEKNSNLDQAWNFGPDAEDAITVEALVNRLVGLFGSGAYTIIPDTTFHEVPLLKLNTAKAHSMLKWTPIYSLDMALQSTVDWYQFWHSKPSKEQLFTFTANQIQKFCRMGTQ